MRLARRLLVGLAATVLTASAAMAADPIFIPPPAPPPPVVVAPAASPFEGIYFGGYMYRILNGPTFNAFGGQVGYNMVSGSFLFGGELRAGFIPGGAGFQADLGVRAGFLLGSNLAIYAGAAAGIVPNVPFRYLSLGGGAEFVLGDQIGIFGEFRRVRPLPGGAQPAPFNMLVVGINFHP